MEQLYKLRMFRTWFRDRPEGWTLVSGIWSPFYLQLREIGSHPDLLRTVGDAMALELAEARGITRVAGIAYAGIPIATATSLASNMPMLMMRKMDASALEDVASYGQHALVEGAVEDDDRVMLVDDLVTRFDSKLEAARQVLAEYERRGKRGVCHDVLVIVDRGQGAQSTAETNGFALRALINFRTEALELLKTELSPIEYTTIAEYLEDPQAFQDSGRQAALRRTAENAERDGVL
jgi:uridine monophosphate synthetase